MTQKPYVRKRGPKPTILIVSGVPAAQKKARAKPCEQRDAAIKAAIDDLILRQEITLEEAIKRVVDSAKFHQRSKSGEQGFIRYERCKKIYKHLKNGK